MVTDVQGSLRRTPQKRVEAHETLFPKPRMDDFGAVGHDVESLQATIDDVAIFLGVGAFAEIGVFEIGALGHQNVFADTGPSPYHGVPVQRGAPMGIVRTVEVNHVENLLKMPFSLANEGYQPSLNPALGIVSDIFLKSILRELIMKTEI